MAANLSSQTGASAPKKDVPGLGEWSHEHTGLLGRFDQARFDPAGVDLCCALICTPIKAVGTPTSTTTPGNRLSRRRSTPSGNPRWSVHPVWGWSGCRVVDYLVFAFAQDEVEESGKASIDLLAAQCVDDIVDMPCGALPGLKLVPDTGHTPGHVLTEIESHGEKAIISGDTFRHRCGIAHPDWADLSDRDQEA